MASLKRRKKALRKLKAEIDSQAPGASIADDAIAEKYAGFGRAAFLKDLPAINEAIDGALEDLQRHRGRGGAPALHDGLMGALEWIFKDAGGRPTVTLNGPFIGFVCRVYLQIGEDVDDESAPSRVRDRYKSWRGLRRKIENEMEGRREQGE